MKALKQILKRIFKPQIVRIPDKTRVICFSKNGEKYLKVFNTENADKTWTSVPKGQIHIPDNYDWKQYVKQSVSSSISLTSYHLTMICLIR